MENTIALAELMGRVPLTPHEAVAIIQQLIEVRAVDEPSEPDANSDLLEHVRLSPQGLVLCDVPLGTPSAAGRLLDTLLPTGAGVVVPGALRYTIARALGDVDAPPIASLAALAASLQRFERDDRRAVVHALLGRAAATNAPEPWANTVASSTTFVERRRVTVSLAEFRRQLREADRLLFEFQIHSVALPPPAAVARRRLWPTAMALVALSALLGYVVTAGRMMRTPLTIAVTSSVPATSDASRMSDGTLHRATPDVAVDQLERPGSARLAVSTAGPYRALDDNGPQFSPAFDPTGTELFFHSGRSTDAHSALLAVTLKDHAQRTTVLDDGARNFHVQPSPDGRLIAFDSDRDGERGVYVANVDGTAVHRISGPGYAAVPTWSPDSERLTFIRAEKGHPSVWNLWMMAPDGGMPQRLTNYRVGQTWSGSWFPDSRRVCYTHEDELVLLDVDSGTRQHFTSPIKGRLVRTPAVAPDGQHVVMQVYRTGAWLLDVTTGLMTPLLRDPTAEEFAWSPDGQRLAFHSRRDGHWRIWVISLG